MERIMKVQFLTKIIYIILLLITMFTYTFAKRMGDPGEGGGSGNEIGPYSSTALTGSGYVNQLTGLPSYTVKLLRLLSNSGFRLDLDLNYGFNNMEPVWQYNDLEPTEWIGMGWHLGVSYIYCVPIDTNFNMRYYYVYSNGTVSEIVQTNDGKWRIKSDPFWNVEATQWQNGKTSEWRVTKTDGSVFVYGGFTTAIRSTHKIKYDTDGCIDTTVTYHYRLDLISAKDINGSSFNFTYNEMNEAIIDKCSWSSYMYTRESYLKEIIIADNGDRILFGLGDKNPNEYYVDPNTLFPRIYDSKFLRYIKYIDKKGTIIDSIAFIYTGDEGRMPHKGAGIKCYEKRQLIGINSTKTDGAINRIFEYNGGLLTRICEPTIGKSLLYTYKSQAVRHIANGIQVEYLLPVVEKTEAYDVFRVTPPLVTTYTYPEDPLYQKYIPSTKMGFWGVVKANSGTGDVIITYDINPENHVFGTPGITMYNIDGKKIASKTSSISTKPFVTGTDTFYYNVVSRNENIRDGIKEISGLPTFVYDDSTGQPLYPATELNGLSAISYKMKDDTTALVTETKFAFKIYPEMLNLGQLTQAAGTKVIEFIGDPGSCILDSGKIVSATFTTWKQQQSGEPFRPYKTYSWKSDSPHYPASTFTEFDTAAPLANGWCNTGTITKYNRFGSINETVGPNGLFSATIYRSDYNMPIANIVNARYDECAAFTGYDVGDANHSNYFDYQNGWEKAGSFIRKDTMHFGDGTAYVNNCFGPSRNIKIYPGKDYIMSAWVYVVSGTLVMNGDYRHLLKEDIPCSTSAWQKGFGVAGASAVAMDKWQRIEMRIPASKDLTTPDWNSHNWCARVYVGSPNGVRAYIDDIRFYPAKAQMTTKYYNMKWRKNVLDIGANNNPGRFIEFDSIGRTKAVYKVDKSKSAQDSTWKKIILSHDYHTAGDARYIIAPNGGEVLYHRIKNVITWNNGSGTLSKDTVILRFFNGSTWITIDSNIVGKSSYLWDVPEIESDNCKIAIISKNNPSANDTTYSVFKITDNDVPSVPKIVTPAYKQEVSGDTVVLEWRESSDWNEDTIYYKVEICYNDGPWEVLVENYLESIYYFVTAGRPYGHYQWKVTASDGNASSSNGGVFLLVPPDFFTIRDIRDRIVYRLPDDLYKSIYNTLSDGKKVKFLATYCDSTTMSGYRILKNGYASLFSTFLSGENNFYYTVNHTNKKGKDKWIDWEFEGAGIGYTGLGGGAGCGAIDGEMRCICIKPSDGVACPPAISFSFDWACPNSGNKTFKWNEYPWTKKQSNAIMRIKLDVQKGYHAWYGAWHRGAGSSGWKKDGEWTGGGNNKVDRLWIRIYRYDNGME